MATLQSFTPSQDRFADQAGTYPIVGTVAPSAARTTSADYLVTVKAATGLVVIFDATVKGGAAPSVAVTVQGFDPVSGKTWDLGSAATLTDVGTRVIRIHPSVVVADCKFNDIVPEYVVLHVVASNTDSLTYSLSAIVTP